MARTSVKLEMPDGTLRRHSLPLTPPHPTDEFRLALAALVPTASADALEWRAPDGQWELLGEDSALRRCAESVATNPATLRLCLREHPEACEAGAAATGVAHTFDLRTSGGTCAGQQWLYDGDEPIARLVTDAPMAALEENLMFTISSLAQPKNPRPVMLREMKLRPGGRPMLSGMQLYWELDGIPTGTDMTIVTEVVVAVEVEGKGTDKLTLTVVTEDTNRVVTSTRAVSVSFDPSTGGYCWAVEAGLRFNCPECFLPAGAAGSDVKGCWQFCDPFWKDIPAPAVEFEGMWAKRGFSRYLMEKADGTVSQAPLNHAWMAHANPPTAGFATNGRLILESTKGSDCACIQFVGATGPQTVLNLCNWGYDCHLALASVSRDGIRSGSIQPAFRIGLAPPAVVADCGAKAAPPQPLQINGLKALPLYSRQCGFDKLLPLDAPNPDPALDAWPVRPH